MHGGPHIDGAASVEDESVDSERNRLLLLDDARGAERRAAVARLASTLSHALGTPLNVISGRAAMIGMREMTREELADNTRIINEQVRSITGLLQRVLTFSREGWPGPEPIEFGALARRVVRLLAPVAEARGVHLELGPVESISARVHASRVEQVLVNLVTAGTARVAPGSSVSLSLAEKQCEPPPSERGRALRGPSARFEVTWGGVLVPDLDYGSLYEPWLQDDAGGADERTTAMLFAVSYGIAREHRGWIELSRDPSVGSTFALCWPLGGDG